MKKVRLIQIVLIVITGFLLCATFGQSQVSKQYVRHVSGVPTSCPLGTVTVNDLTGDLYSNKTGTGCVLSGNTAASAVVANSTVTSVPYLSAANTFSDSLIRTSGSTVGINLGAVAAPSMFTVGDTASTTPRGLMSWQSSNDTSSAHLHMRKSRGTFAVPTTIVTGDILGRVVFSGYEGTSYNESAYIRATSTGTIAATRVPTKLEFFTSTDAAPSVATLALTLNADQTAALAKSLTLSSGALVLTGASSGTTTIQSPAVAGSTTVTMPNASSTLPIYGAQITYTGPSTARTVTYPDQNFTVLYSGGPLGTPSSGTLTSATGLPISTGLTGAGTGVLTALGVAINTAGGFDTIDGTATLSNKTLTAPVVAILKPVSNSTTAVKVTKADGSTAVLTVDTTNSFLGIGNTPSQALEVTGNIKSSGYLWPVNGQLLDPAGSVAMSFTIDRVTTFGGPINGTTATFSGAVNKLTITPPASGSTLTVADGKTATVSNTLTFTGTDSSSVAFGAGGTVVYTSGFGANVATFLATPTSANFLAAISDETGSGLVMGATSPTISTPRISQIFGGTAAGSNLNLISTTGTGTTDAIVFKTGTNGGTTAATVNHDGSVSLNSITTDAGHTTATVCVDTTSKTTFQGSGTVGICLGTSSRQFKRDITPLTLGLTEINSLLPVSFNYLKGYGDDGVRRQGGFLAEDVYKTIPSLVGLDKEGKPQSVDYMGLVPLLVNAVQEQQKQIDALRQAIKDKQ